ncbi:MAG: hypothetical protein U1A78_28535 [Polyangia bacterium]
MNTAMLCAVVSGPPAAPLAIAALLLCAGAAVYAWGLAVYAWIGLSAKETRGALRWGQRVLSVAALLSLAVFIASWLPLAAALRRGEAAAPATAEPQPAPDVVAAVASVGALPQPVGLAGPDPLLARPTVGALLIGLLGLTLLRARAAPARPANT